MPDIDEICELLNCQPGEAPERVRQLLEAARAGVELLDALRVCSGVGHILTPGEKDAFRLVDEALRRATERAK